MSEPSEHLMLIVVGASIDAERQDRPLAEQLVRAIRRGEQLLDVSRPYDIVTCTDVWFLNDHALLSCPVISVGRPDMNAATAFLAGRLPTALIVDHCFRIHLDPCGVDRQACLWATEPESSPAMLTAFRERYLDDFIRAAHDLPTSATDLTQP